LNAKNGQGTVPCGEYQFVSADFFESEQAAGDDSASLQGQSLDRKDLLIGDTVVLLGKRMKKASRKFGQEDEEGIEKAKTDPYQLILLDYNLPTMNGSQVCHILKREEKTRNVPVVFMSAKDEDKLSRLTKEAGADGYIGLPFEGKKFIDIGKSGSHALTNGKVPGRTQKGIHPHQPAGSSFEFFKNFVIHSLYCTFFTMFAIFNRKFGIFGYFLSEYHSYFPYIIISN
jgi:CheY-like chemotaxis protein